jgi:TonB family protein
MIRRSPLLWVLALALLSHASAQSAPGLKVCVPANPIQPCAEQPPRVIKQIQPQYSKDARKKKIQGRVVVWLAVGTDGLPRDIRVQQSLGYGLDEEAIKAVKKWKFLPARMGGQPVCVTIAVEVDFHLY